MLADESMRLNKYISESGICSRREADRFIEQGHVYINGKRAGIGDQVFAGDLVKVNGQVIEPREADSLVEAAERLHVTQTTITARVQNLEQQLDCRLFVRNRAGARLTADGEVFVAYANQLVQTWEAAQRDLRYWRTRLATAELTAASSGEAVGFGCRVWHTLVEYAATVVTYWRDRRA